MMAEREHVRDAGTVFMALLLDCCWKLARERYRCGAQRDASGANGVRTFPANAGSGVSRKETVGGRESSLAERLHSRPQRLGARLCAGQHIRVIRSRQDEARAALDVAARHLLVV